VLTVTQYTQARVSLGD